MVNRGGNRAHSPNPALLGDLLRSVGPVKSPMIVLLTWFEAPKKVAAGKRHSSEFPQWLC
jgi:hypothetical protein